ncbi:MAG: transposase [Chthoniobacterales bacterium]|nr:transposase [Chthoniobacterales bacterium]
MSPDFTIPEDFQGFDCRGVFWNYERNLPHWRQPGATYFVTFRLNDSLPCKAVDEAKREKEEWNRLLAGQITPDERVQEEFAVWQRRNWQKAEALMDECHGSCVLRQPPMRQVVVNSLTHFEGARHHMHGLVVMPNHVHLACQPWEGWEMEDLLQSWKGFTSRAIAKMTGQCGRLWQHDNWNRIIRDEAHWQRVMRYIAHNPEKAKLYEDESTLWIAKQCRDVERTSKFVLHDLEQSYGPEEDQPW